MTGTTRCGHQARLFCRTTKYQTTDTCSSRKANIAPKLTSVDSSVIPSSRVVM